MMFFMTTSERRAAKKTEAADALTLTAQREEIQKKFDEIEKVNQQLANTVAETKAISIEVAKKLKSELKIAKRSFTSFNKKLPSGVMLVDYQGNVIQLNPAGEKIFALQEEQIIHRPIGELVKLMAPILDQNEKPVEFSTDYFLTLSTELHRRSKTCGKVCKVGACDECVRERLPSFLSLDHETQLTVRCGDRNLTVDLSFTLLDNTPDDLNDFIYVFIFRKHGNKRQL